MSRLSWYMPHNWPRGLGLERRNSIQTALAAAAKARVMMQWPGRIVGMTATPWRLSRKEGFDHLFDELICWFDLPDASCIVIARPTMSLALY